MMRYRKTDLLEPQDELREEDIEITFIEDPKEQLIKLLDEYCKQNKLVCIEDIAKQYKNKGYDVKPNRIRRYIERYYLFKKQESGKACYRLIQKAETQKHYKV